MARGRMIDRAFTTSSKLNKCSRDTRLAYASILGYLDREGRIQAEPLVLKANVFIRSDFTIEEIAAAVTQMAEVGLIHLYADGDNAAILEYVKFDDLNKPNKNEAASKLPGPDDEGVVGVWDEALEKATGPHVQASTRAHADAMHVQPTEDAPLERKREVEVEREVKELSADADAPPKSQEQTTHLSGLIEVWNAERGNLRAVVDVDAALANDELRRLSTRFLRKHKSRALEIFRTGIAAVRDDPHWLGRKAASVTRPGAAYGITNYLRHVEEKYDAALAEAEEPTKAPPRPWREYDIADHIPSGVVATLATINDDGTAITVSGETWNLSECVRCNN